MEAQIVEGSVGSVGKYDVEFKEGALVLKLDAATGFGKAGVFMEIEAAAVLDALKNAIPGHFDDLAIDAAKQLLLGK